MEEKKVERTLMSQEEFEDYIYKNSGLKTFIATGKFRSINRAIRRAHVINNGMLIPKRPFNNRANSSNRKRTHSRGTNELKKRIYAELRQYNERYS